MALNWRRAAPVAVAAALFAALVAAAQGQGERQTYAAFLGLLCGVALYHASFGFTGGWRRMVRERRGDGFRAQMLLIALIVVVSYPLLTHSAYGDDITAWVQPVGLSPMIGAAMFGLGMQLGGGCGSGVLFTVGGGSTRMLITLFFFLMGSLLFFATRADFAAGLDAASQAVGLAAAPSWGAYSFLEAWGAPAALGATLALLAALAAASVWAEKRAHGAVAAPVRPQGGFAERLISGPWTKTEGAALLALAAVLTLIFLERPWGVTAAFQLWGAKLLDVAGAPVVEWGVISERGLERSLFWSSTSVMNFGLMLGALAAAGLAGKFAPVWRLSARDVLTAVIGGLLMGYGARLAFGCNIGGLLGGVASGSLHGWQWLLFGWLGSWLGVKVRGAIGMDAPRRLAARP